MARKKKQITLCADDFGLNENINLAVCELAAAHRISATSCLTQAGAWPSGAQRLRSLDIDIGLHINLTEKLGPDNDFHRPLSRLIMNAWLRQLDPAVLARSIEHQCDLFEQHAKRTPDFFDGHQHVHQFPQIRDALMEVLIRRYDCDDFWVRSTAMRNASLARGLQWKARLIALLGSSALRRRLQRIDFPYNEDFAGVYALTGGSARFERNMQAWLAAAGERIVIMCHPADGIDPTDVIGAQRAAEFAFLKSDAFADLLATHYCRLVRYPT